MTKKEKLNNDKSLPKTVDEAVKKLLKDLPIHEKYQIVNMPEGLLFYFHFGLGLRIRNEFGLWKDNEELMNSCKEIAGEEDLHVDTASSIIIKALRGYLQKHPLPKIATRPGEYPRYY